MNKLYKIVDVTKPIEGRVVITNSYWQCVDGNPEKALYFGETPQCNKNKAVSERLCKNLLEEKDNVKVVFIEVAYGIMPTY